tara:strand:- start:489 stop:701 length:213 start_codon:yes stop_codon:yes gene_type:complete
MTLYVYTYIREQRATVAVEADNEDEAFTKAEKEISQLKLYCSDDESDDPGYLIKSEINLKTKKHESKQIK